MRVIVNMLSTLKPMTGVGQYTARLYAAMRDQLPDECLRPFPTGATASIVRRLQKSRGGPGNDPSKSGIFRPATRMASTLARQIADTSLRAAFRTACRRGRFDLYHEPNFIPMPCDMPTVITVHDLSVALHPEWHPADRVRQHERTFHQVVSSARHIITDTNQVRREVIEHLGVAPDRVTAIPIGVGREYFDAGPVEAAAVQRAFGLPSNYLLFVGTIEPRKNISTLLRAFADLPADMRQRCPLVLAGGWGWRSDDVAEQLQGTIGVIHLGFIEDRHLPGLYAGARALAFPSHYEGFGLPPLEMLAAGGAVLASTANVLHETLGRHACFTDALDLAGWRDALRRAIADDDWLAELRRDGRAHAGRFSWAGCASATIATYRAILEPRRLAA